MSGSVPRSPDPGYTHDAPFDSGHVAVSDIHSIYYEQYGPPDGKPGLSSQKAFRRLVEFVPPRFHFTRKQFEHPSSTAHRPVPLLTRLL